MSLEIIKAGLLDTVQDTGRYGFQHQGINPGGAMDRYSACLANALLGKELREPVVEMHFPAAKILFRKKAVICLAGADFTPLLNGDEVSIHQPVFVDKNSVLSFNGKRKGARCYLSVLNSLAIEPWLNSYSTNLKASAGGYYGRRLEKDDEIRFADLEIKIQKEFILLPWRYNLADNAKNDIEFIAGPEWNWLSTKSQTSFLNNAFLITPLSDRMGYRLEGEVLEQQRKEQLISSAVNFGTVQLLPSGQLIVLMADHQTTGGYPRIANVISAHLPQLSQLNAGDKIAFVITSRKVAEEKFMAQQKYLHSLQNTCKLKIENWLKLHA
jgi:antagonist of KipI